MEAAAQSTGREGQDAWNGLDFLHGVQGSTGRYPIIQTLFLASRVGATGLLSVELERDDLSVRLGLVRGRVQSVEDVPGLLAALQPAPPDTMNLMRDVGGAVALGHPIDRVLSAAASALGLFLVRLPAGTIRFHGQWTPPPGGFPLPASVPRMLAAGLREARSEEQIRSWWKAHLETPIRLRVPEDSAEDRWGLDAGTLRMLKLAPRASTPSVLVDIASGNDPVRRQEMMRSLDLLHAFGILHLAHGVALPPPPKAEPARPRIEPPIPAEILDRAGERPAERIVERPASRPEPRSEKPEAKPEVKPEVKPEAAKPAPGPADPVVERLEKILRELEGAHPAEALGMVGKRKVNAEDCAAAFREVSKRVHPDLYADNPAAREVAERCFALVNAAHELSQAAGGVADVNRYLEAKHLNVQYVPEKEHVAARLAFRKAEIAWRNREWAEASESFDEACARDPVTWPHALYRGYARYLAKKQPLAATIKELEAIPAPKKEQQAEVQVVIGNLLKQEGQADPAMARYKKALEANPENRDAQREIRLQEKRAADAAAEGWLGRLMNKKT